MPRRPPSVCSVPGCPRLSVGGHCPVHRSQAERQRGTARQRGYDTRWQQTRADHLAIEPRCRECGEPATDVDHIDGLGPTGPRGHDHANLRSLCHPHHSQRTARDQPGGWNAR